MKRRATILTAVALLTLTGCGGSDKPDGKPATPGQAAARDAADIFTALAAQVKTAKLSGVVTADNDPNHLLGRPSQYTSKITFTDTRIEKTDVEGLDAGGVGRGGAIEQFAKSDEAHARAQYIQAIVKVFPLVAEYDYIHGTSLIRVSHLLTPTQAGDYHKAADQLP
ncbi:hypothetical protein [Streptomyces sp. NBC_00648]|uniref:hypothetical protein n=1 Tax=Streptomyces sp. NBC_00648 TaxID=2975797 RepID=UPI00324AEA18